MTSLSYRFGMTWESNLYKGLSEYVDSLNTGYVHRIAQQKLGGRLNTPQVIDILVDNVNEMYFGVECKATPKEETYASKWFGRGQYEMESKFLNRAGRLGLIAFALRSSPRTVCGYLIPWTSYQSLLGKKLTAAELDSMDGVNLVKIPDMTNRMGVKITCPNLFGILTKMYPASGQ